MVLAHRSQYFRSLELADSKRLNLIILVFGGVYNYAKVKYFQKLTLVPFARLN